MKCWSLGEPEEIFENNIAKHDRHTDQMSVVEMTKILYKMIFIA